MCQLTDLLKASHQKSEFSCGISMLDNYLHKQANQDMKRKLAVCFVLNHQETNLIKGYYTLSNNSIHQKYIPEEFKKNYPILIHQSPQHYWVD